MLFALFEVLMKTIYPSSVTIVVGKVVTSCFSAHCTGLMTELGAGVMT